MIYFGYKIIINILGEHKYKVYKNVTGYEDEG